jgi:hypothetical protein
LQQRNIAALQDLLPASLDGRQQHKANGHANGHGDAGESDVKRDLILLARAMADLLVRPDHSIIQHRDVNA